MEEKIHIADICGLCHGSLSAVNKTIELSKKEKNVTLYKEILHNKNVIDLLKKNGTTTKNNLNELTKDDYVIIRAHGEPYNTFQYLKNKNIKYLDCTCPNVKAINLLVKKKSEEGFKIIIVGKHGFSTKKMHPEVEGIAGWCIDNPIFIEDESEINNIDMSCEKYFLVMQTTFSSFKAINFTEKISKIMADNKKVFEYRNTLCNGQKNINNSAILLAEKVDVMLVMGNYNSSNSVELYNNISKIKKTYFIENKDETLKLIKNNLITKDQKIGITAGASTLKEDIIELKNFLVKNLHY